jgi:hypothetical protein
MSFKKPWRVVGLVAIGVLVGSVIGPPIVQAASSLVTIQGAGSTHKAKVDSTGRLLTNIKGTTKITGVGVNKASQLFTGQAAPTNYQAIFIPATPDCTTPSYTVPVGKALIVTGTTYFLFSSSAGTEFDILLATGGGGTCTGFVSAGTTQNTAETVNQTYPTGIPIPTGTELSALQEGSGSGSMFVYGYLVPAGAVSLQQGKGLPRIGRSGSLSH